MRLVIGAGQMRRGQRRVSRRRGKQSSLQGCDSACGLSHYAPRGHRADSCSRRHAVDHRVGDRTADQQGHDPSSCGCTGPPGTAPDGIEDVPRLFGADALPGVGQQFLERRVRNALVPLTGEGQEERTYRHGSSEGWGTEPTSTSTPTTQCAAGGCQRAARCWARTPASQPPRVRHVAPSDGGHEGMHQRPSRSLRPTAERFAQASTCGVSKWSMGGCLPSSGVATSRSTARWGCTSACCRGGLAR